MDESIPEWVRKRDGRLVPFEADRISQSLFAVTESLGQPDAFLARELTDAIVHYLPVETSGPTPTTEQIAEVVVKYARELGHPQLARLYEEYRQVQTGRPQVERTEPFRPSRAGRVTELTLRLPLGTPLSEVIRVCTRQYTLQAVYSRDVVALHNDDLLRIQDLEAPERLAGVVLSSPEAVRSWRDWPGRHVALDGPEHWLARTGESAAELAAMLEEGLCQESVEATVNLNCAIPPAVTSDLARGPLFGDAVTPTPAVRHDLADALLDQLGSSNSKVSIHWHLGEHDFAAAALPRLQRCVRAVLGGSPLVFVLDRPRRPIVLGNGLTRGKPALLQSIHLDLVLLAEQTDSSHDVERFLQKLGSLVRLALSAGVQKRAYLRRGQGASQLSTGFLLDRARLLIVGVKIEELVRRLSGRALAGGGAALELGRRITHRLSELLRRDGRAARLDACQDGSTLLHPDLVPEDLPTAWKQHWRVASVLHAAADLGTLCLPLPSSTTESAILEVLRLVWQQSEVVRVCFQRPALAPAEKLAGINL